MDGHILQSNPHFPASQYIREIGRGVKGARSLSQEDTYKVFSAMLAGRISDLELGALLLAWRIKGESVAELAGMLDAAHATCNALAVHVSADIQNKTSRSPLPVIIPSYNGARKQANLVPLLAMLLAREGVPVLVHGITSFANRVTTAAIFEALGITACVSMDQAENRLENHHLAFLPIHVLSPAIASLLEKRNTIGLRNSAHTIVKMLQPIGNHGADEAMRLVNYTHPEYLQSLTEYFATHSANVLLARGTEGEAVADARRMSKIIWINDGREHVLAESGKTFVEVPSELPSGLDMQATAAYIQSVISGQHKVPRPIAEQVNIIAKMAKAHG